MTPGEFPLSLSVSGLRFPSLFKLGFGFFSDQRKEVLLAPPYSPGIRRGGGGARGAGAGGRSLRRLKDAPEGEGVGLGVRPPPRRMISQPGCPVCCALWPRCCWDLASSPDAVLPERGVARGSGGPGNQPTRVMLPSLTLVRALSVPPED